MGTPKVMRLLDGETGLMECKVCGARHLASIKPDSGGKYSRGSWQCQHGCDPRELSKSDTQRGS